MPSSSPHSPNAARTFGIGWNYASEVLSNLGIDFEFLAEVAQGTGLPIADLGSCFSTFPVEAALRGIPVIAIDPRYGLPDKERADGAYRTNVSARMAGLPLSPLERFSLDEKIELVMSQRVTAEAAALTFPNRGISILLSHQSLPKYSRSPEYFLQQELPEILRVTDQAVYLFPLAHQVGADGDRKDALTSLSQNGPFIKALSASAESAGFDLSLSGERAKLVRNRT